MSTALFSRSRTEVWEFREHVVSNIAHDHDTRGNQTRNGPTPGVAILEIWKIQRASSLLRIRDQVFYHLQV